MTFYVLSELNKECFCVLYVSRFMYMTFNIFSELNEECFCVLYFFTL